MKQRRFTSIILIIISTLILGFIDLSPETKKSIAPFLPDTINESRVKLGLDLQGGAQLDYKIDLRNVAESDREQIVEGVEAVIRRRVDELGVSEPNIYQADVADEKHITVELAGITDLEEAKNTVGKTIQLEFKEQKSPAELNDPDLQEKIKKQAQSVLNRIKDGEEFSIVAEEETNANPGKVLLVDKTEEFEPINGIVPPLSDEKDFINKVKDLENNTTYSEVISNESYFDILHVTEVQEIEKDQSTPQQAEVSHILIAYEGAERAADSVTRTKEEARKRAEEVLTKAKAENADFAALAKEYSDGGSADDGGKLSDTVQEGSNYVEKFETAALALKKDEISDLVETEFGFHIIKADSVTQAKEEKVKEVQIKYERLFFDAQPDPWKSTGLTGEHFERADADFNQGQIAPVVRIRFNQEGAELFKEITERNIQKPVAIFVGGTLVSAPNVETAIDNGEASITGVGDIREAQRIARELNTGAIPAPIVLSGQYTIGSTLGQEALDTSLKAGVIGLAVVALYMIFYYRLLGLIAVVALSIYSVILLFLIKIQLPIAASLLISIVAFIWLVSKIINSKDSGWEKVVSLTMATFGLFFLSFLLSTPVVLTLAGVAGVILSIGMAVDANILIFERMKEEIKAGRPYSSALEIGFARAWSSIRDSNFSSLITCGILFYVGTSIIKGFAFNLAAGIVVSMLTAITITRSFLNAFVGSKASKNATLFAAKKTDKKKAPYKIIEKSKIWFSFSGALIIASIISLSTYGLQLGMDFTGGTLMELKFEQEVSKEDLSNALIEIEENLKAGETTDSTKSESAPEAWIPTAYAQDASTDTSEISTEPQEEIDFGQPTIVTSDQGLVVKLKLISEETHEKIKKQLEDKFGKFEETRFNTVGPTVGETMRVRAIVALGIALLAIVLYVAFAFRRIPKEYSPWRFGFCAIIALAHDVIIATGIFAMLGFYFNVEIDILFITALLTILGFSVHDTIVVFDRVRENIRTKDAKESFEETTDKALTQTMARSINTSVSTLITLLALFLYGSESIQWFVLALIIGTVVGTYSSIFTASPVLVAWHKISNKK